MRFEIVQHIPAPAGAVARAYADPAFYDTLVGLPKLGRPEALSHEVDGDRVRLRIRYQFVGELSSAVRAVVDPRKLSWVEDSVHDLTTRTVTFQMDADHYADRFRCTGSYQLEPSRDGAGTVRRTTSDLSVRMAHCPGVGGNRLRRRHGRGLLGRGSLLKSDGESKDANWQHQCTLNHGGGDRAGGAR